MRLGVRVESRRKVPSSIEEYWKDETGPDVFLDMVDDVIIRSLNDKDGTLSSRHVRINLSDSFEGGAISLIINELENNVFRFRGNTGSLELLDPGESVEIITKNNPKEIRVRVTNISC